MRSTPSLEYAARPSELAGPSICSSGLTDGTLIQQQNAVLPMVPPCVAHVQRTGGAFPVVLMLREVETATMLSIWPPHNLRANTSPLIWHRTPFDAARFIRRRHLA